MSELVFEVEVEAPEVDVAVEEPAVAALLVTGPQGPPGEPGPPGPSYSGIAWFFGDGEPATIIGSKPGDLYMNLLDGTIFRLGDYRKEKT